MDRLDKYNYYLDIAESVSKRGTCLRKRYGAVIVKNDEIISQVMWGHREAEKTVPTLVIVFATN